MIDRLLRILPSHSKKIENEWRKRNDKNFTTISGYESGHPFPLDKVWVGNYTYGHINVKQYNPSTDCKLFIGHFCSIAAGVTFLLGGEHNYRCISTFPFKSKFLNIQEANAKGNIVLEDDVWIGDGAKILSGVKIARGTVVAAGSLVVNSTLPYSIVGGNPARLIKMRFSSKIIELALQIDYSKIDKDFYLKHEELFSANADAKIINEILNYQNTIK